MSLRRRQKTNASATTANTPKPRMASPNGSYAGILNIAALTPRQQLQRSLDCDLSNRRQLAAHRGRRARLHKRRRAEVEVADAREGADGGNHTHAQHRYNKNLHMRAPIGAEDRVIHWLPPFERQSGVTFGARNLT